MASKWISLHDDCRSLAENIGIDINSGRGRADDAMWRSGVRRKLGKLGRGVEQLASLLIESEIDRQVENLSDKEIERRRALVDRLKVEKEELNRLLNDAAAQDAALRERDLSAYETLNTRQHLAMHKQLMRDQDDDLDILGASLRRQRIIGEKIGQEADESTHLINNLQGHTDVTTHSVQRENDRIVAFDKKQAGTCILWVIIALLAIIVIVLLATDGGCYIIKSEAKCKLDHIKHTRVPTPTPTRQPTTNTPTRAPSTGSPSSAAPTTS